MNVPIKQGFSVGDYGSLTASNGEQKKVLGISGFGQSSEISVLLTADGGNTFYPYKNDDGAELVIEGDGYFLLQACNAVIKLECETPDDNLKAFLS